MKYCMENGQNDITLKVYKPVVDISQDTVSKIVCEAWEIIIQRKYTSQDNASYAYDILSDCPLQVYELTSKSMLVCVFFFFYFFSSNYTVDRRKTKCSLSPDTSKTRGPLVLRTLT